MLRGWIRRVCAGICKVNGLGAVNWINHGYVQGFLGVCFCCIALSRPIAANADLGAVIRIIYVA